MDKNTRKSSFGKWISPINFKKLDEHVSLTKQDHYTKKLTTASYIKMMLLAQLHETESLHAMSDALLNGELQQELGFASISASQLSRKNNEMDPSILATIFMDLVAQIKSYHHSCTQRVPLKIIDSSTLPLNLTHYKWAKFRKTKAGVKLHLRLVFM
ncbi:DUF4372 domain-containing protein, partial [Virgibacillus sp. W0181]